MFEDRFAAGRLLAERLQDHRGRRDAVALAIPRGGVAVGYAVSRALGLALDVLLVRKIGHPENPEFAVGSVGLSSVSYDPRALAELGVPRSYVEGQALRLRRELRARHEAYLGGTEPIPLAGKIAILLDDGAATGSTLLAAVDAARRDAAQAVLVAVPVASRGALKALEKAADEVVCLESPEPFYSVGSCYRRFDALSDVEAIALLREVKAAAGKQRA